MMKDGGFTSFQEKIDGHQNPHTQRQLPRPFHASRTVLQQSKRITSRRTSSTPLSFELGKVEISTIRERVVYLLNQIEGKLARGVADNLGIEIPAKLDQPMNMGFPADANPDDYQPIPKKNAQVKKSAALTMANTVKDTISDTSDRLSRRRRF